MIEARNPTDWSNFLTSSSSTSDHDDKKNINTDDQKSNAGSSSLAIAIHVKKMVSENKVLVIGRRGCFMCYVMKRLLLGIGVSPMVYEVDEEEDEKIVINELVVAAPGKEGGPQFPVVCIGGKLFGGLDRLMSAHITGELEAVLQEAGSLWL